MYFDFYFAILFFLIIICSSLIVGIVLLKYSHKNSLKKILLDSKIAHQKTLFPLKIKAVERFALYLERIKVVNLVTRIKPISNDIAHYKLLISATIEQEFNHNAVQKIYVSTDCYKNIENITQETINYISQLSIPKTTTTPIQFNEVLLSKSTSLNKLIDDASTLLKMELKTF
ncbi:MAG: hypothetical protein QM486_04090 [Flavobacteriaceae bacterium]